MKYGFLFLQLVLALPLFSQSRFTLHGHVTGRDTGRIILKYPGIDNNWIRDTAWLKNGRFEFHGAIREPSFAVINGYPDYTNFYDANEANVFLEPAVMTVSLVEKDYAHAKMEGSHTQREADELKRSVDSVDLLFRSIDDAHIALKKQWQLAPDDSLKRQADSLYELLKPRATATQKVVYGFVRSHPDSYVSAYMLAYALRSLPLDSFAFLHNGFTPRIRNSRLGRYSGERIMARKANAPGSPAPLFTGYSPDGKPVSLATFKDQVVVLDFWASWCIPCIEKIPILEMLNSRYKKEGLVIIMVSIDRKSEDWKRVVREKGLYNFEHVLADEDLKKKYLNTSSPIPSTVVIDRDGKIVFNSNEGSAVGDLKKVVHEAIGMY